MLTSNGAPPIRLIITTVESFGAEDAVQTPSNGVSTLNSNGPVGPVESPRLVLPVIAAAVVTGVKGVNDDVSVVDATAGLGELDVGRFGNA